MATDTSTLVARIGRRLLNRGTLYHLVFWSWNCVFLAFVWAGLVPECAEDFYRDYRRGFLPFDMAVTFVFVLLVPTATTVVAFLWLRTRPLDLLRLFYGLELPLFLMLFCRLVFIKQLTGQQQLLLIAALLGLASFAFDLTRQRPRWALSGLRLVTSVLLLGLCLIASLLVLLYAAPVVWEILGELISLDWLRELTRARPMRLLGGLLACLTALQLVALPFASLYLYFLAWRRSNRDLLSQRGKSWSLALNGLGLLGFAVVLSTAQIQAQQEAFALLDKLPASDQQRRDLLQNSGTIRGGLLNAYLAQYRYLDSEKHARFLSQQYAYTFSSNTYRDWRNYSTLQKLHNALAAPWLYQGEDFAQDGYRASVLYQDFFDAPIQQAEQIKILSALTATFNRSGIEAGLLDRNADKVWLVHQELELREHGDWAEVEIHETYQNITHNMEEIFYSFALPKSAAITGLWLGDSADKDLADKHIVAPRGAAQRVYKQQVRRRIDPALLEQVGPQQYRLRVFPIPAAPREEQPTKQMHLWLTYKVLWQDGGWPLPQLLERRNVFWTKQTTQTTNGKPTNRTDTAWLSPKIKSSHTPKRSSHTAQLADNLYLTAEPVVQDHKPQLPRGLSIAVVVDRSFSMAQATTGLANNLDWIKSNLSRKNQIDWYLTSADSRGEPAQRQKHLDRSALVFYGGQSTSHMLHQFVELSGGSFYDLVLVLTDSGGYALEPSQPRPIATTQPVWLVHVSGHLPRAYADPVLEATRSGGVVQKTETAMAQWQQRQTEDPAVSIRSDGYLWRIVEARPLPAIQEDTGFAAMAAHLAIHMKSRSLDLTSPGNLDQLHRIALKHQIVSPYSSMIVLINEQQRQALKRESEGDQRFSRSAESGAEALGVVSGVPEPETWALLLLGMGLLGYRFRDRLGFLRRFASDRVA